MLKVNNKLIALITLSILLGFSTPVAAGLDSQANQYNSYWDDFVEFVQNRGNQLRKECPDNPHPDVNASNLEASLANARQALRNGRGCRAVRWYLGVIEKKNSGSNQEIRRIARKEIFDAYIKGDDPYGAMNAGTFYVGLYGIHNFNLDTRAELEKIRFKIIETASKYFHKNAQRDPFWEKMVMGVHHTQTRANPMFQFFTARLFLADFPRSSNKSKVNQIVSRAKKNIDNNFIAPAKGYLRAKAWKAVIMRTSEFWDEGPTHLLYGPALLMSVKAYIGMARDMSTIYRRIQNGEANPRIRRNYALNKNDVTKAYITTSWLELYNGTAFNWIEEITFMMDQAKAITEYMESTMPGEKETTEARSLYNKARGA